MQESQYRRNIKSGSLSIPKTEQNVHFKILKTRG